MIYAGSPRTEPATLLCGNLNIKSQDMRRIGNIKIDMDFVAETKESANEEYTASLGFQSDLFFF